MNIDQFITKLTQVIVNPTIILLFAIATVVFLWGVLVFIQNAESPEKRKEGSMKIMYGLIGMFIMISAFAIANILFNTFVKPNNEDKPIPEIIRRD